MNKIIIVITALIATLAFSTPSFAKANVKSTTVKTASIKKIAQINLNTAGAEEIADVLTGVGIKKAQAIVAYRNQHGKFTKIEELASVKGIGVMTLTKNQGRILLK